MERLQLSTISLVSIVDETMLSILEQKKGRRDTLTMLTEIVPNELQKNEDQDTDGVVLHEANNDVASCSKLCREGNDPGNV